jgi:hypothetical protein
MDVVLALQALDPHGDGDALGDQLAQRPFVAGCAAVERPADLLRRRHPSRAQLALRDPPRDLALGQPLPEARRGQAALGQIPEPLLAVAAGDHHFAPVPEQVHQHRDAAPARIAPASGAPVHHGAVFQLARPQGAALAQHLQT